jgi:hypothetical protein
MTTDLAGPTTSPPPALALALVHGLFPPPWFVPIEAPACAAVLEVPPEATNDGIARRFVCDQQAGHADRPEPHTGEYPDRHRQVTDNAEGTTLTWAI